MAGLCAPLSTLRRHPRGYRRMTRGQCGSLDLHCKRLALSTPCRSSRRTENQEWSPSETQWYSLIAIYSGQYDAESPMETEIIPTPAREIIDETLPHLPAWPLSWIN